MHIKFRMRKFEAKQAFDYPQNNPFYQSQQLTNSQSQPHKSYNLGPQYSSLDNQYFAEPDQFSDDNALFTNPILRNQAPESQYSSYPNQRVQNDYIRREDMGYQPQNVRRTANVQYENEFYDQSDMQNAEQYLPPKSSKRSQVENPIPRNTSNTAYESQPMQERLNTLTQLRLNELNNSFSGSNSSNSVSVASTKRSKKPLVVMKIDIGGGQMDDLVVFDGDDPLTAAQAFCHRNNLNPVVAEPLQKSIKVQLMNYKKKREEREREKLQQSQSQSRCETEENMQSSIRYTHNPMSLNSSKHNTDRYVNNDSSRRTVQDNNINYGLNLLKRTASTANIEKERSTTPVPHPSHEYSQYNKRRSNSTKSLNNVAHYNHPSSGDIGDTECGDEIDTGTSEEFRNAKQAIFNRLYRDAMIKEQRQHQLKETLQMEKKQKESVEATFRPKINKSSANLAEKRREFLDNKWQEKPQPQSQIKDASKKPPRKNLELSQSSWQQQQVQVGSKSTKHSDDSYETQEKTFAMPIGATPKSTKNAAVNKEIYSRLYQDAEKKDIKQSQAREAAKKDYSFKPSINKRSDKLVRAHQQVSPPESDSNNRSYHIPKKPVQKERSLSSKRVDPDIDPKTGQKLFQPIINKHNKYYQAAKNKEDKAFVEEVVEVEENAYNNYIQQKTAPTVKKSLKEPIINSKRAGAAQSVKPQAKEDKFLRIIFNSLDADGDGIITADNVDISQLNTNVLEIISDILFSLEEQDASYDFDKFKKIAVKLGLVQKLAGVLGAELDSDAKVL